MRKKIIILGAGYGGLTTAITLQKKLKMNEADVILVNPEYHHCLSTSLHKLAAGSVSHTSCEVDIRNLLKSNRIKFMKAFAESIDFKSQSVKFKTKLSLEYDYLVIAIGGEPETFGIPGLKEHALCIRSIKSAQQIQEHIENKFVEYKKKAKPHLNFVIGGSGFTGIQFTGELTDQIPFLCKKYRVDSRKVQIYTIEAAKDILPGFHPTLAAYARHVLEKNGVAFKIGVAITACRSDRVILSNGEQIPTESLIWTGGVRGNNLQEQLSLETSRGRVLVDDFLCIPGYENVFVVGDGSLFVNKETKVPYPPTAQIAVQQGKNCAENIIAKIRNLDLEAFSPNMKGTVVSIGSRKAAGILWGRPIKGSCVHLIKKMIELYYLYLIGGISLASKSLTIPTALKLSER